MLAVGFCDGVVFGLCKTFLCEQEIEMKSVISNHSGKCVLVANPDGVYGSPPMVSGLSGFGVSKQNRKFLKSFLVPNITL